MSYDPTAETERLTEDEELARIRGDLAELDRQREDLIVARQRREADLLVFQPGDRILAQRWPDDEPAEYEVTAAGATRRGPRSEPRYEPHYLARRVRKDGGLADKAPTTVYPVEEAPVR